VAERCGTPLPGFFGGLVSSTATTLVYARHAREDPAIRRLALMVIVLANIVVLRLGSTMSPAKPASTQ
jgi:uncharacterized membrane protein (DUF4010 family)